MKSSDKLVSYSTNPTELPGQRACLFLILPGHEDHINSILDNVGKKTVWKLEFLWYLVISQVLYSSFEMYYPKLL